MDERIKGADITIVCGSVICAIAGVLLVLGLARLFLGPRVATNDGVIDPLPNVQGGGPGSAAQSAKQGVAADDGELHEAFNDQVSYTVTTKNKQVDGVEHLDAYDLDVKCEFSIEYPQVSDDVPKAKQVNRLLRRTAMTSMDLYYREPSDETAERIKRIVAESPESAPLGADALLGSTVDYAISYNTEDFLSVCFSDTYYIGNEYLGFVALRCVNVNLKTGETYELGDVLTVDEDIANAFLDNLVQTDGEDSNKDGVITDDECFTLKLGGRKALVEGIMGKGELAENRVNTCLFVDGNGQPNLGVNYWLSGESGLVRGWWDVTITDEQIEKARKDSSLWELLGK